ncbi:hypothetical protein PC113_g6573 [Phytophthora cactorum]|uniref:HTH CENPB-type domain-containing protein n=3 Tax=Phytophthora cactorum TaxID=29920 RepID=A0A8T0ZJN7_9STRA|nr:hypothetical protein PC113_g6573 [Phytophthora cactorum]
MGMRGPPRSTGKYWQITNRWILGEKRKKQRDRLVTMRSRDNKRKDQDRRADSHRDGRRDARRTRKEESRDHRVTIDSGEEDFDRRPPSSYESESEWSDDDQSSGDDSENDSDYMDAGFGSAGIRLDLHKSSVRLPDEMVIPLIRSSNAPTKTEFGLNILCRPTHGLTIGTSTLTKRQDLQICHQKHKHPNWNHRKLSIWSQKELGLPKVPSIPTVSKILKRKDVLRAMTPYFLDNKTVLSGEKDLLDMHLVETVPELESRKAMLSGEVLRWIAREYADLFCIPVAKQAKFTKRGWQHHFMARYGLRRRKDHGVIGSADVEHARRKVLSLRAEIGRFHPDDVFNMDDAAFFFRATPQYSITLNPAPALKQKKTD